MVKSVNIYPTSYNVKMSDIPAYSVRAVVAEGHTDINRVKAHCRVGMGRCQGRMCSSAAVEIIAHAAGCQPAEVGRLRAQAPIKPLPFGVEVQS